MSEGAILSKLVRNMKARGEDPLRPLLDAYLLERGDVRVPAIEVPDPPRPHGRMSPSDLCGCERAAVFKFLGMKARRRVDPDRQLVFDDGNWRHVKWQSLFVHMEEVLGRDRFRVISIEQAVQYPELYVAGSLDVVLWLKPHPNVKGKKWVVDIKGINDAGFQRIVRDDAPLAKHPRQLMAYERAVGVPRGLLWYENKNNQLTKAFIVRYDDDGWREVESWCSSVLSYLSRRRLPPMHPDCDRGTYTYEKCPYSEHCFGSRSAKSLQRMAYDAFTSLDELWEEGRAIASGDR